MMSEKNSSLSARTLDVHRCIDSIREELEAIDVYNQRAEATLDETLKGVLLHNAREEKEHAAMLIEWLRRNDPEFADEVGKWDAGKPLSH